MGGTRIRSAFGNEILIRDIMRFRRIQQKFAHPFQGDHAGILNPQKETFSQMPERILGRRQIVRSGAVHREEQIGLEFVNGPLCPAQSDLFLNICAGDQCVRQLFIFQCFQRFQNNRVPVAVVPRF
ncbi:hypothetical protein SDC9_200823 [bioreactor metagenome]|uniref:Uncharacterized protein n=1 Tax=bioreactor metagenome TaxID=1076179 RepID=A0A645IS05_9ZZZZ